MTYAEASRRVRTCQRDPSSQQEGSEAHLELEQTLEEEKTAKSDFEAALAEWNNAKERMREAPRTSP